nr:MAG: replication initiator protein [Microvirus sp.]
MPCFHPLRAFRSASGDVVFVERGDIVQTLDLPCGQCIGCRLERSRQWAVRITHEASLHSQNCFITLTYDDDHLPSNLSLDHSHFQRFLKRYRKRISPLKIRYYMAGEYGDDRSRPHYHACIFGHCPDDLVLHSKSDSGQYVYTSDFLQSLWPHGYCSVGELTFESAAYVARYVLKKITGPLSSRHYEIVDVLTGELTARKPEYARMSLKPGIAAAWFGKYRSDVYPSDHVLSRGHEAKPPRFYDKLLTRLDPDLMELVKFSRQERARLQADDNTRDRLEVKETLAKRRVSDFLSRRLK